jgi:hypothetical protein
MKTPFIIATLLGLCCYVHAQSVQVSNLEVDDEGKVSFRYSVSQKFSDRERYELQVFTSADNFSKPIDLNLSPVAVGESKSVSFDGPKLISNYEGSLQFRFKVVAAVFPVRIVSTGQKFKSGKSITISWDDFHESGWYDVELYSGGYISRTLASNYRGTLLSTTLPKKMEKGTYEIRVTPTNQKELQSDDFPVTISGGGGAGIFIIAGGGLAAGAGVLLLGGGGDSGGGGTTDTGSPLPDPPNPGGN